MRLAASLPCRRRVKGGGDLDVTHLVSTMPLSELALAFRPAPPPNVTEAARMLRYRSILTVNLILDQAELLPDTWIYLHASGVRAARMQFYKNWSPDMVADPEMSSTGLEYFIFENEPGWQEPDEEWIRIAREDLIRLGMVDTETISDASVLRYPKAYPLYEPGYRQRVALISQYLEGFDNLACAGRYGQFRYNNMDHSIMTGWLAVRRLLGEEVDPWAVGEEADYLEERASASAGVRADIGLTSRMTGGARSR